MYYDVDLRKDGREKHMDERSTNQFTRVRSKKTVCAFLLLK